jgi:hypothetical protein
MKGNDPIVVIDVDRDGVGRDNSSRRHLARATGESDNGTLHSGACSPKQSPI